jgi:putative phosphoribosyl transferase
MATPRPFKNRLHAGKLLAQALQQSAGCADTIVLALPRGGVPVGFAVARALHLELDILLVRKLGLPGHAEYAMGAVGSGGVRIVNRAAVKAYKISASALDEACRRELAEIARRERQYRGGHAAPQLHERSVILVDDGLATGATMRAAVAVARRQQAARIVGAVPVGAPDSCRALASDVDDLVCLVEPPVFVSVSQWYKQFDQTEDDEVQDLLALAWRDRAPLPGSAFSHPGAFSSQHLLSKN